MKSSLFIVIAFNFTLLYASSSAAAKADALNRVDTAHSYDITNPIVQKKLAFVHTILKNTTENHSHRLNGASGNQYYLRRSDGAEAVFDAQGNLVTDCANKGKANLANPATRPLAHFAIDVLPWLINGNCDIPVTRTEERVLAYIDDIRDALLRTISLGGGFYLPENPNLQNENYRTYFLLVTELERYGVDIETFMRFDFMEEEPRETFLTNLANVLLRETVKYNS